MSKARIEQMLQECLDGYEAGLTPEECLSAYPQSRPELEPLLRQALSLRIAYATSPSEEFRHQTRERLLFAAGRDVRAALAKEPDPDFVQQQRLRFLNMAGASAQEALRDVPPPRLAFWVNARRRLMDAAAGARPTPARRFAGALRYSVSAAVVAIAVAVVALSPIGDGNSPNSPAAALAALEQQLISVEQRTQEGQAVSSAELDDLADRTTMIANSIDQLDTEYAEKIGGLIVRQQEVAKLITPDQTLTEAQQQLAAAQEKIATAKTATPAVAAIIEETPEPTAAPTEEPEPGVTATPEPLQPGEVQVSVAPDDNYDLSWQQVRLDNLSFVIPTDWSLLNVERNQNGVLMQVTSGIGISTGGDAPIIILVTEAGQVIAHISGVPVELRGAGAGADTIAAETLAGQGEIGLALHHFVLSLELTSNP